MKRYREEDDMTNETVACVVLERLQALGTATLHEVMGRRNAVCPSIRPLWTPLNIAGVAVTVRCPPGDNLAVHQALTLVGPDNVLAVAMGGFTQAGFWGEVTTTAAQVRGLRGLVTDGSVRDSRAIRQAGFPVFSASVSIQGTVKNGGGCVNEPVSLGGVVIYPGDYVIGDDDGVVVVPAAEVEAIIEAGQEREQMEQALMIEIRRGRSTMELLGLQAQAHDTIGPRGDGHVIDTVKAGGADGSGSPEFAAAE